MSNGFSVLDSTHKSFIYSILQGVFCAKNEDYKWLLVLDKRIMSEQNVGRFPQYTSRT